MSTRVPLPYTPRVLELFREPRNLGRIDDADAFAQAGSPACGDVISIYLRIRDGVIEDAKFESYGCAANIAAASVLTEIVKGKRLEEAWNIDWQQIADELGGLPPVKKHCSILAVGALRRAIRRYFGDNLPEWLPKDLTSVERQALEEEEMIERIYGKLRR
ncbi:iron-sulfur cluster assembly scaffold protein [Candidatus Korarchaeum cryptofilum]|jgi:nitrogen fixation NifU-like protein|uniref:Iron-sulfur cluster assembly scaffold protein n=1 Tax=Candidatus Korarchaeum cryptofilum TaxID=498846 RepID=A0A429GAS9_9CREN|nr:iron-sulfur cluster assembly scaffold protein [Candidatus Korarchaeum cryptofilum]RSN70885.1 iron-sulfur cluster assembly scaffold protein [Candidatus Korarchaeum cryptofilum]